MSVSGICEGMRETVELMRLQVQCEALGYKWDQVLYRGIMRSKGSYYTTSECIVQILYEMVSSQPE